MESSISKIRTSLIIKEKPIKSESSYIIDLQRENSNEGHHENESKVGRAYNPFIIDSNDSSDI